MVVAKYDFPLPNNGDRYDFTQDELVKLLNKVYDCGYENARSIYDVSAQATTAWASYDMGDEQNDWYNSQFIEGEH